jgi:hypothetical protein
MNCAKASTTLGSFGLLKCQEQDVYSRIGREQMREDSFLQELAEDTKVDTAREAVLIVLRRRFGETVEAEFRPAINAISHLGLLWALHAIAVQSRRICHFRMSMPHS